VRNRLIDDVDRNSEKVGLVNNQTDLALYIPYHQKTRNLRQKRPTTPRQEHNTARPNPQKDQPVHLSPGSLHSIPMPSNTLLSACTIVSALPFPCSPS
jgi:hypothetical protein